jgi:glutathione peroxidase-family protein
MKDARQMVIKEIESKQIDNTKFNEEMIKKEECIKILGYYEARKLDVLSILSNPFKYQFDKNKERFVFELALEQAKIEDEIVAKYEVEFIFFIKACRHYGLMKIGHNEMEKDALIIKNNLGAKEFASNQKKWSELMTNFKDKKGEKLILPNNNFKIDMLRSKEAPV